MPSNKITNNLKVFNENKSNILSDTNYSDDSEREDGFQAGDPIRSEIVNKVLRDTSLVVSAFIEALRLNLSPGEDTDVTNPIVVGTDTDFNDLVLMIGEALNKNPLANLHTIALSGSYNDLRDKPNMMLRSVVTSFNQIIPGFYSITSSGSDRPLNTEISWGLIVYQAGSNVIQQIATSKTNNRVFLRSKTGSDNWTSWEEVLRSSDKTNTLSSNSTNDEIPGAKAVFDYVEGRKWKLIRTSSSGWFNLTTSQSESGLTLGVNTRLQAGDVLTLELKFGEKKPLTLVQLVLNESGSTPIDGDILRVEIPNVMTFQEGDGEDIISDIKAYFSYVFSGSNLLIRSLSFIRSAGFIPTGLAVTYKKHDYYETEFEVKTKSILLDTGSTSIYVRRIWLMR